ncbi:phytanoyl-CoA dioxygenase family protein [Flagellimonas meridianipacifica]|uniref:Ectoine hydroxylase-related dioxygenase (Phytanoyl-CoA dioxygenase family) n=1 Tax=Flagellimonas meridianipacifica TaxID=1080225 RepID=A0A2T0MGL3_9FLAO|nr:phytanoyl-CoA dioxygenase family protein [Allomuricauda pacifica]PRX56720.1 ectoine hydroxylase-related dioxygenase (phytanoyl-CoA dioxygenase family) [Allomuricauda pacifica]
MNKEYKMEMANKAHEEIPGNPSTATSSTQKLNDRSKGKPLRVLSEDDWNFWMEQGYVVIKNAVSKEQAKATADFLWEFDEKDPNNPETWYAPPRAEMKMKELTGTGMVEVYNHQYLWNNRQTEKVYNAFVDVWGTEKLWVTIDRANLNFPLQPGMNKKGFIHWDYDPETKPQNVQGVLALADQMDENMGGFQCIPWLYRNYDTWKLTQPEDRDHFQPDISGLEDKIVKVKMEAGDLLIFNSTQPHGIRPNKSGNKVRIAQYISMMPAEEENESLRQWRINSWKNRVAPEGYAFPGDPRNWERDKYETAKLNPLGERLLGLTAW